MASPAGGWRNVDFASPRVELFDRLLAQGTPLHHIEETLDWLDCMQESSSQEIPQRNERRLRGPACRYDVAW